MQIYSVCFFGHRIIDEYEYTDKKVYEIVSNLIREKEYVEFLIGREGDFDQIVSSAVIRAKRNIFDANSSLVWIQPYLKADYRKHPEDYERYYDSIEVCVDSASAHPKAAIQIRNRTMVDRSDLCVFYVSNTSGGAYQTMKYAMKQGKRSINICEQKEE